MTPARVGDPISIVGAGGLGREVLAALEAAGEPVEGFVVDPCYPTTPVAGLAVRHDSEAWAAATRFVIAIGDARARARAADRLTARPAGARFAGVRHPAATVGPRVSLGRGSLLIGPLSVTVDVEIGDHALLNPGCTIAHDCRVGRFANLGPRASLAGGVVIEDGASLGTGAVVGPRCRVGAWATVGAGAVVIRDVPPGMTVVGVPARPIEHRLAR